MTEHFPLMIPGARADGKPAEVFSPYDGSLIATVEQAGSEAIEKALLIRYNAKIDE